MMTKIEKVDAAIQRARWGSRVGQVIKSALGIKDEKVGPFQSTAAARGQASLSGPEQRPPIVIAEVLPVQDEEKGPFQQTVPTMTMGEMQRRRWGGELAYAIDHPIKFLIELYQRAKMGL